jgi:hypothetical protein
MEFQGDRLWGSLRRMYRLDQLVGWRFIGLVPIVRLETATICFTPTDNRHYAAVD